MCMMSHVQLDKDHGNHFAEVEGFICHMMGIFINTPLGMSLIGKIFLPTTFNDTVIIQVLNLKLLKELM